MMLTLFDYRFHFLIGAPGDRKKLNFVDKLNGNDLSSLSYEWVTFCQYGGFMISNPLTDRRNILTGDSQNENKSISLDPSLTITVVIFCLLGPFWLIYRLAKTIVKMGSLVADRSVQVTK
jgi:hypothetical protein